MYENEKDLEKNKEVELEEDLPGQEDPKQAVHDAAILWGGGRDVCCSGREK